MRDVRGSDEEFVAFFSAHARALRRTAYGLVGDWDRAEDLTQSAFARVYPHWERVRRGNPHAYTRQTMVRLFIDGRKYAAEHLAAELPELPIPLPDTEARVDLGRALGGLSRQMRAVVVLRYLDDRPVAEVASLLGIAEGTVKAYTHRALAELHDVLQPVTGGDR
ncbi:MAG: SigE family RNA polymerase sigma factor [Actinomycetales bacterium]|jgi:RNA polymerase sigma-70 factor (sigma-E family)|nr:SigE family RNA polymerase sigma factor [Candidatus Phosphoribacter baldrii]MBK6956423.1 SigE family RNA polymerase sigma factor [Candidatus Phosphoribacter baldrii]MBK7610049.1 SigE family RNA polymerase sigma factor [Candidatus Phosphoribacter baldrii]HRC13312.1 SigE family RNA polymerase sigma factor [Dermatophilaceae bacterium]